MFCRLWSGLPEDPHFPSDMKELGYFVNEDDEIRSINDPNYYFKFFINKNARYNERQRYAMNEACEKLIHERLENLGLTKVLLPIGTTDASQPHLPIFVSADIKSKSRVIVIFGETYQDLGILAHRVIGGPGGVNKGSMVSIVKEIQMQTSSPTDTSPPGIILANTGQTLWSPELKRALTIQGEDGAPRPSAVHAGMYIDPEKNKVPGNGDMREHIKYVLEKVIPYYVDNNAGLDIVGLGDGADGVERYLDWGPTFTRLQGRINCLAIIGGYSLASELQCSTFRQFLREKASAWTTSSEPLGMLISGPDGNPDTTAFTGLGCPMFSGGEEHFIERLFITSHKDVLAWLQLVADTKDYKNPEMPQVDFVDPKMDNMPDVDWTKYQNQEGGPDFGHADPRLDLSNEPEDEEERKKAREERMKDFEATFGKASVQRAKKTKKKRRNEEDDEHEMVDLSKNEEAAKEFANHLRGIGADFSAAPRDNDSD